MEHWYQDLPPRCPDREIRYPTLDSDCCRLFGGSCGAGLSDYPCTSHGQPLTNPIKGQYYDWAVGYHAGLKLSDYWKLEDHKLGETSFTHFPDGTAH
jgi:hypothetical protein